MTPKLEIAKGGGRLYFDEGTGYLRIDAGGLGLSMQLDAKELKRLSRSTWAASVRSGEKD